MGIRKDLKKLIKELNDASCEAVFTECVIRDLEEILMKDKERKNKRKKKVERNEYIAVKQSDFTDTGDNFDAIRDGYGVPPIGYKYVKVWR